LTMEGQIYKVELVGLSNAELKRHIQQATAAGIGEQLLMALQQIVARLKKTRSISANLPIGYPR
jgi:hypothetical protein